MQGDHWGDMAAPRGVIGATLTAANNMTTTKAIPATPSMEVTAEQAMAVTGVIAAKKVIAATGMTGGYGYLDLAQYTSQLQVGFGSGQVAIHLHRLHPLHWNIL